MVGVTLEVVGVALELNLALGETLALDQVINWTLPPPRGALLARGVALLALGAWVSPDMAKYVPTATIAENAAIPRTTCFL